MRILAAMMKHETNSFSPVKTDLARFEAWGLHLNEAVLDAYRGTNMPIAAYIELAERRGAELVTPVAAEAMPSGLVEREAYETLVEWILAPIEAGDIDAVFLDLHGAMTAEHLPDGEGHLLQRIREIAPDMPIAVTLDMHTNLTAAMVANCDVMIGYKSYPHTDMYDVGRQIAEVLWDKIEGRADPVMAWGPAPVLAQTLCMGSDDEPMKSLQEATRREEKATPILAATVFGGFPMVDVEHAGASVVTVADGDSAAAEACRDRLLSQVWSVHEDLVYEHRPVMAALKEAKERNVAPIVLLDHADNVGSGGTSDVMTVIKSVIDSGLQGVAVATVFDPEAAAQMHAGGEGAEITVDLGGKLAMPSLGLEGQPLRLTGKVLKVTDGRWIVRGPMYTGVEVNTGPTAVFETGGVKIVVTSVHHEPWDAGILSENGIDPLACRYILLKSRIHYRAGFAPLAKATYTLDGQGVTTSDNSILTYKNIRRPIYPLDPAESVEQA
ncbi:M81 family metallopeptidase [Denitrobaculum tricleocarpae]|uniref:Microcystinase C n=1 Tax=Denitrobaculum tricleocarpae TaxID=2591009 RepID=A0A545TG52_9PROT|nr:M81 family metallopeptidase [Denitrobaculum tricleocarpae]TQV76214.1 M81 family metallopeptidase [Denitrobaculum tricleocarpae]